MEENKIKEVVKKQYSKLATNSGCCKVCGCGGDDVNTQISKSIGYSDQEINAVPEANMGLGCGNPLAFGAIKIGDVVLDLGSGAGLDAFLASKKVGESGKVIGVDMTPEMIERAQNNAKKYEYKNVEFKLGDIEALPIEDNSIDIAISNCVINLVPDKLKAFKEIYRVLRETGKVYLSDIVLMESLTEEQRNNEELIAGCVGGASLKDDYIKIIEEAGFKIKILAEDKDISKKQYQGLPVASLKIEAQK